MGGARRSPWTKNLTHFMDQLAGLTFYGGGNGGDCDIVGGLVEALTVH